MTEKTFSKKEAISHGIAMTRKYAGFVAIIVAIILGYELLTGTLQGRAGLGVMTKEEVTKFYGEERGKWLWESLVVEGYINQHGRVLEKLNKVTYSRQLSLPEASENDREAIFHFLQRYMYRLPFPQSVYVVIAVLMWILDIILQLGMIRISLMLARDEKPFVAELFGNGQYFISSFLAGLCFMLAVLGGVLLLIVPGVILMVMLGMYAYFIVDQEKGPIASLKASRELTRGARWQLFLFGLVITLFNLAGALCLLVGLLF